MNIVNQIIIEKVTKEVIKNYYQDYLNNDYQVKIR